MEHISMKFNTPVIHVVQLTEPVDERSSLEDMITLLNVTVPFDDDASTATNDEDVADDADEGVADDYADVVAGDDVDRADDDGEGTADDDAGVAADTGVAFRVGRSSPGVVLTAVRGIAFLIVAPFLAAFV
ncbi:unnamed protein product [Ectocarpus sp. CCAP 1310/34]|nr:unnamed protein product [Ectocarpus sp. CCAP 1310/34]